VTFKLSSRRGHARSISLRNRTLMQLLSCNLLSNSNAYVYYTQRNDIAWLFNYFILYSEMFRASRCMCRNQIGFYATYFCIFYIYLLYIYYIHFHRLLSPCNL